MTITRSTGLSLKPQYYEQAHGCQAGGLWFEVHPENYFVNGGPRLGWLEAIRANHPIALHGVALSLASDCAPDLMHLRRFRTLVDRIEPVLVSEHLAWSSWRGAYHPDLLPFPLTAASLSRVADNIALTQEALGRRIAIENPSHYVHIAEHTWDEIDFLTELARRTGCGLLVDVNNIHIGANNLAYSASQYIDRIPTELVMEIHLAGHAIDSNLGESLLIDSHDCAVSPSVWCLYQRLIERTGCRPTLIERDDNLPPFNDLLIERAEAQRIMDASFAITGLP